MMPPTPVSELLGVLTEILGKAPTDSQLELIETLVADGKLRAIKDFLEGRSTALGFRIEETQYRIERPSCSLKKKGEKPTLLSRHILCRITDTTWLRTIEAIFSEEESDE